MMRRNWLAVAAIALPAASTGVVVPVLRALVEHAGRGPIAASVFIDAHVIGGVIGAACAARLLRVARSARALAAMALIGSIAITLAMAAVDSFALRVGLRFLDGACHLLAITALFAAATAGDPEQRTRRAVTMGLAIVLGIAGGVGVGAMLHQPESALVIAAGLSGAGLVAVLVQRAAEPGSAASPAGSPGRGPVAPGLLAFGERFIFGSLSIALPFRAAPKQVGLVIGVAMAASVIAMPIARRAAVAWGARRLAVRSTLAFTMTLVAAPVIDTLASYPRALAWAIACGASAGALYASALVLVARSSVLDNRVRDMAIMHAAGNAGFTLGALCAGMLVAALPGMLVIALPGVAIIAAATLGVWITVPAAARDCPVIGGLVDPEIDGEPGAKRQPVT